MAATAPTWSIVYVPVAAGGVIPGGVITMKPAAFYSLIHNIAYNGIVDAAAAAANAVGNAAYDVANLGVARVANAAALVTATATQNAPANVAANTAANTAANAYFTAVFAGRDRDQVENYFTNIILPNFGAAAAADPAAAGGPGAQINTDGSFAFLILMKYDGPINTSNHVDTYYHKYLGAGASQAGALYNAFNTVNPLAAPAGPRSGGYRKQSKKHRRKYSKGRTARK